MGVHPRNEFVPAPRLQWAQWTRQRWYRPNSASQPGIAQGRAVALRQILRLKRRRHQEPAEGGDARQPLPIGKAQHDRLGLAVARDDGWLASRGLIHHRRQLRLGIFQLNLPHEGLELRI